MSLGLDDATQFLHAALDKGGSAEDSEQAALAVMSSLADPAHLSELLKSVHANSNVAADCAGKSYLHPLGFHKLMLVDAPPLFELRIHAWRPTYTLGVDHIHNHRFGFVSSVIRGGYDMQIFQTGNNGTPMHEYRGTMGQRPVAVTDQCQTSAGHQLRTCCGNSSPGHCARGNALRHAPPAYDRYFFNDQSLREARPGCADFDSHRVHESGGVQTSTGIGARRTNRLRMSASLKPLANSPNIM
jgi:hypothetical protein